MRVTLFMLKSLAPGPPFAPEEIGLHQAVHPWYAEQRVLLIGGRKGTQRNMERFVRTAGNAQLQKCLEHNVYTYHELTSGLV